jgi:hypothetical protein
MALSPLNWRMMTPRVLPPGYTITTILDAVYAMGTDTAYADGTTRTPGSGSAWTWTRDTALAGYNTACIGVPPINALGMSYLVAGDTAARAPAMNTDSYASGNMPLVAMNKNSGAYTSWVNAAPFTTGYFSDFIRGAATTTAVTTALPNYLYMFECQEAFYCVWLGGASNIPLMWGGGAIIDPLSAAAANAESDGRLYSVWGSSGTTFSTTNWLSTGVGFMNGTASLNGAHLFTFNVGAVDTTRACAKIGSYAPTINLSAPNGETPVIPLQAYFTATGQFAGQFRQMGVTRTLTTGAEQNVQGTRKGYTVGYSQQASGDTILLSY